MGRKILLFQREPYKNEGVFDVVSCNPSETQANRKENCTVFEVILNDTILYPGGGGQPADRGSINGLPLLDIRRRKNGEVVHFLPDPVWGKVKVEIDWPLRFDHMQQHTAQHVLTAIGKNRFGLHTSAFHLGPERSDIELNGHAVTPTVLKELETAANRVIRENLPVKIMLVDRPEFESLPVRTRGLPSDHEGLIRLIEIGNTTQREQNHAPGSTERIDLNTCGGTHVSSTGELQMIKITSTENLTRATRVFFLAGNRVRNAFGSALEREAALNEILSCGPKDHVEAANKLQEEQKSLRRENRVLSEKLARRIGESLAPTNGLIAHHEPECQGVDPAFLRRMAESAHEKHPHGLVFITAGEKKGFFILLGSPETVNTARPIVLDAISGRGGGPPGMCQGKAEKLDGRHVALERLIDVAEPAK